MSWRRTRRSRPLIDPWWIAALLITTVLVGLVTRSLILTVFVGLALYALVERAEDHDVFKDGRN